MAQPNENGYITPPPPFNPGDGPAGTPIVTGGDPGDPVTPPPPDMGPYPDGVPDFRDPAQNPNPNYYDPNEDVEQYGYQTGINGETNYDINVGMTGGLMDTVRAVEDSPYANRGYGVAPGQATNRQVQQEELSQYQLQQMLASDSPLMKQAGAQGLARAGGRGLMNSSLGTGAAQGAMIAGAQPFALADADRYGKTAADNMNATNSMAEANLGARVSSMQAGAERDRAILMEQLSGYGDIRKAMIGIEDREDTQAYNREERLGGEDFTANQNKLNRDWTSDENMLTNSLAWASTKLDAATKMGITREQAFSEMYSSIMSNPDPKFKAAERAQAVRDMKATLDDRYGDTDPGAYELSYDPATGMYDESLKPSAFVPPPTETPSGLYHGPVTPIYTSSGDPMLDAMGNQMYLPAYSGSQGGQAGIETNFDPANPSASNPSVQQYGSQMSSNVGQQSAALPGVAQ